MSNYLTIVSPTVLAAVGTVVVLVAVAVTLVLRRRGTPMMAAVVRAVAWTVLATGTVFVLVYTLVPAGAAAPAHYVELDLIGDLSGQIEYAMVVPAARIQLLANLLLLSWLGFLPVVLGRLGVLGTFGAGAAVSLVVEVLQYVSPTGRVASLTDFVLNSLGVLLGALVGVLVLRPALQRWAEGRDAEPVTSQDRAYQ